MGDTDDGSVESQDPREWSGEKVATFVRALGPPECFQSGTKVTLHPPPLTLHYT